MSDPTYSRIRYRALPTMIVCVVVVLFAGALLVDTVRRGSGQAAWLSVFGAVLVALIAYVVGVRPAVIAEADHLVVRNPLQAFEIPWSAVEDLRIRYGLDVVTKERTVHAWAVPSSRASRYRDFQRQWRGYAADMRLTGKGEEPRGKGTGFADRVLEELEMVMDQRKPKKAVEPGPITTWWAWEAIVPAAVSAVGIVIAILVG